MACSHQIAIRIILRQQKKCIWYPKVPKIKISHTMYNNRVQIFHIPIIILVRVSSDPTRLHALQPPFFLNRKKGDVARVRGYSD
jgi:hypothetical protein